MAVIGDSENKPAELKTTIYGLNKQDITDALAVLAKICLAFGISYHVFNSIQQAHNEGISHSK